jgi:hypothetical protein
MEKLKITIKSPATFAGELALAVPGADEKSAVSFVFRYKGANAFAAWTAGADKRTSVDMLAEVIADWSGPEDEDGDAVAFSPAALGCLMDDYPGADAAILKCYVDLLPEERKRRSELSAPAARFDEKSPG